ncbi:MAG TPA: hypothetical protein GXZ77_08385 [Papillibacter sp.]|jgi:hypothetical protein|nr:hypothetical protein [Papillibacter sp.]
MLVFQDITLQILVIELSEYIIENGANATIFDTKGAQNGRILQKQCKFCGKKALSSMMDGKAVLSTKRALRRHGGCRTTPHCGCKICERSEIGPQRALRPIDGEGTVF